MIVLPWSLLVRRAATLLAVLALLQALLPAWHRLDHVESQVVVASHVGHGCGHQHADHLHADNLHADNLHADGHADDLPDDGDHGDCPLCVALQAGMHAADLALPALVMHPAPPSERLASPDYARFRWFAARWIPPARGPPRRS